MMPVGADRAGVGERLGRGTPMRLGARVRTSAVAGVVADGCWQHACGGRIASGLQGN